MQPLPRCVLSQLHQKPDSSEDHHRGQLKPVYFRAADIAAHTIRSYRIEP